MTRKDYVILAAAIKASYKTAHLEGIAPTDGVDVTRDNIIKVLKDDNSKFNEALFRQACRVN